jgi:cystathionine beta-synthase
MSKAANVNSSDLIHESYLKPKKIYSNISEAVGFTPLVQINNITKTEGIKCQLLAKCDYMNPMGSAKDRAARRMVLDAEKMGKIKPKDNYTLIEPTSGNTGIGLSLMAICNGYNMICTLPKRMSQEKEDVLKALGAKVIRCDDVPINDPRNDVQVALKLSKEMDKSINLDQYGNLSNPLAHYDQTAEELIEQCDGKIDYFICSPGTGGTISGVGKKLKEKIPGVKIIGIDPYGSILALPKSLDENAPYDYKVEGVGKPYVPENVNRDIVDEWVKVNDKDSFIMARRAIKEEALLIGGSAGLALAGAVKFCKGLSEDKRVVVFFTDGIRNYMSKYISDDWMVENHFMSNEEYDKENFDGKDNIKKILPGKISDLVPNLEVAHTVKDIENLKVLDILNLLKEKNVKCILYLGKDNKLLGLFNQRHITIFLSSAKTELDNLANTVLMKEFRVLDLNDPIYFLSRSLERYEYIPIKESDEKYYLCKDDDVLKYILKNKK